jgi:hypothetical protein
LKVIGVGQGQTVSGNATWFAGADDTYFWSGACSDFAAGSKPVSVPSTAVGKVNRRPDGTILPLSDGDMRKVFGDFNYKEAKGGRIVIDKAWVDANIVSAKLPILDALGYAKISLHREAVASFEAAFTAVDDAGLADRILTYAGTFVPRHKGWDPTRTLSSHSWGVAIDLNVAWNGYGQKPAGAAKKGSLVELVPFFEARGFAWGGFFGHPYEDGMHFELARLDL